VKFRLVHADIFIGYAKFCHLVQKSAVVIPAIFGVVSCTPGIKSAIDDGLVLQLAEANSNSDLRCHLRSLELVLLDIMIFNCLSLQLYI